MSSVWEVEFLNKADPWEISMNSFAQVQSDWLQTNSERPNFIQNRTHYLKVYDDSIYTEVVTEEQNVYYMLRDWSKKNTEDLIRFFTAEKLRDMVKNTDVFFEIEVSMNYNGTIGKGAVNFATLKNTYLDSYNYYADFGQARFYFVLNREVLMGGYKDVFPSNGIYVTKYADYYTSFGCTLGWISPLDQRYIPKTIARKEDLDGLASEKYVDDAVGAIDISEQLQADWNQSDETALDFIKNKPDVVLRSEVEEIDALELVTEMGFISPVAASDGSIYTDENGALYSL